MASASQATDVPFDVKGALRSSRWRSLWRLMDGYHWSYLVAACALGAAALLKTGTYLLLRYFIDDYLVDGVGAVPLPLLALAFVGIAVFEGAFTYVSGRLAARTAEGVALRLRRYLFDHLQRLPFAYYNDAQTGELISRSTSDVDAIRRFFSDQAIGVGRIAMLFAVNLGALIALHAPLALLSVAVVPVIVAVSLYFFGRVGEVYEAYQEQEATLSTTLQENLAGVRVVKAFARQRYEIDRFERDNWEKFQRGRRFISMHSLFWPLSDALLGLQMLVGYYVAGRMVMSGAITIGTYLAYAGLLIWIIWPMRNMGRLIVQMSMGLVSFHRVTEIVREEREDTATGLAPHGQRLRGNVVYEEVSFGYEEDEAVLEAISFRCQAGEKIALLGSTGSGKTTLVHLLPRFYEPTAGRILLDGIELSQYAPAYLREQIGIVEQEPFLFSRSIRENITYGLEADPGMPAIEEAARAAAIHEVILGFPDGYDTIVGERGVTLSGGQKQRLAIARTLLKNPSLLILDDATSSVDMETEATIQRALERLMEGRTSFIIAHRISSVMGADLILVMDEGRIVQRGTHEQLLREGGLYKRIFEVQSEVELELARELSRDDH